MNYGDRIQTMTRRCWYICLCLFNGFLIMKHGHRIQTLTRRCWLIFLQQWPWHNSG